MTMMRTTEESESKAVDTMRRLTLAHAALTALMLGGIVEDADVQHMDEMWGERVMKLKAADAER